jgi:hypothetical protein
MARRVKKIKKKKKTEKKEKIPKEGCFYCGKSFGLLPYKCKFCGQLFCVYHHLPENHNCIGLVVWKEEKGKKIGVYEPFRVERKIPRRGFQADVFGSLSEIYKTLKRKETRLKTIFAIFLIILIVVYFLYSTLVK